MLGAIKTRGEKIFPVLRNIYFKKMRDSVIPALDMTVGDGDLK